LIQKRVLRPDRVRKINGGFSFIPHRFLTDGFLSALSQKELLLYFFLVLVSDRCGLSFTPTTRSAPSSGSRPTSTARPGAI
jgi:hypothetical protein